jgi:hypothetical protein
MRDVNMPIRIVSSTNNYQGPVDTLKFDSLNPHVFIAGCGPRSDEIKLMTNENCDEVWRFQSKDVAEDNGHVVFVINSHASQQQS